MKATINGNLIINGDVICYGGTISSVASIKYLSPTDKIKCLSGPAVRIDGDLVLNAGDDITVQGDVIIFGHCKISTIQIQ